MKNKILKAVDPAEKLPNKSGRYAVEWSYMPDGCIEMADYKNEKFYSNADSNGSLPLKWYEEITSNYETISSKAEDHDSLIEKIEEVQAQDGTGTDDVGSAVLDFLDMWL